MGCETKRARIPRAIGVVGLCLLVLVPMGDARAQQDNLCDAGEAPDLIVGDIHTSLAWTTYVGITAFSIGTISCNIGTCQADWISETPDHPVIGQNMFRLKDGRFEQIGQSWLKHGFQALNGALCFQDCVESDGDHLGVHCSDPYSAFLNGTQLQLGPKFEVNAVTGEFPFPATNMGVVEGPLHKRLQVRIDDLDPSLNEGASYFVEAQYIAADDGSPLNNASYRPVQILALGGGFYDLELTDETVVGQPAIQAWAAADPSVRLTVIDVPNDGRFLVAAKATDLGGFWRYEYAVQNLNSHRSAKSLSIAWPSGAQAWNVGFHDVDYHSGEPFDGTDWAITEGPGLVTWTADNVPHDDENALRWGTLYNFRFEADAPPTLGTLSLKLLRPPASTVAETTTLVPGPCNGDGFCDPGETCGNCPDDCREPGGGGCCGDGFCDVGETSCDCVADCGPPEVFERVCNDGKDTDCDGSTDCDDPDCCAAGVCAGTDADVDSYARCDCDDSDPDVWLAPGEVLGLRFTGPGSVGWDPPAEPGAVSVAYELLRFTAAADPALGLVCLTDGLPTATSIDDREVPWPGSVSHYLVRARNGCPSGTGTLGRSSDGLPRPAPACP